MTGGPPSGSRSPRDKYIAVSFLGGQFSKYFKNCGYHKEPERLAPAPNFSVFVSAQSANNPPSEYPSSAQFSGSAARRNAPLNTAAPCLSGILSSLPRRPKTAHRAKWAPLPMGWKSRPPSISVEKNNTSGASSASSIISFPSPTRTAHRAAGLSLRQKAGAATAIEREYNRIFGIVSPLKNGGLFVHCTQNAVLCTLTHTVLIELLFLLASITHFFAKSKDMRGHHRTSFCTNIPAEILRPGCCLKLQFQFTCTTHLRGRQSGRGRHRSRRTLR